MKIYSGTNFLGYRPGTLKGRNFLCRFLLKEWYVNEAKFTVLYEWNNPTRSIPLEREDKTLALPGNVAESLVSPSCNPKEIVLQLKQNLQLDHTDLKQPTPETKNMIRCLAETAKYSKRIDVVKHLREITPAGTTGEFASRICLSVNSFSYQFVPKTMKPDCHVHYNRTATLFKLDTNLS